MTTTVPSEWRTIQSTIQAPELDQVFRSSLVPVNAEFTECVNSSEFVPHGYSGMPSEHMDFPMGETARLANFWLTTFGAENGEVLFEAYRSASPVHFGERTNEKRKNATIENIRQLLLAAALRRVNRLDKATAKALKQSQTPLAIHLTAVDLQSYWRTAGAMAIERGTVSELREAVAFLRKNGALSFESVGQYELSVQFEIVNFNFPTHPTAFRYGQGWELSEEDVESVLPRFLDRAREYQSAGESKKAVSIARLIAEIEKIRAERLYREPVNIYGLSARVLYLAYLLGDVVHFNCRSGKDRTGMLDTEIKFLAYQEERIRAGLSVSAYSEVPLTEERPVWTALLLQTGNDQVQYLNTGYAGSMLYEIIADLEKDTFVNRVGRENWIAFKGNSRTAAERAEE